MTTLRGGVPAARTVGGMRPLPPSDTPARDLSVAAVALAGGLALFGLGAYPLIGGLPYRTPPALYLPLIAVSAAALALRRRAPLVGLAVATAAFVADVALGASLATAVIFTQVLYEACVHGPAATWRWLLRVSVAVGVLGAVLAFVATGEWRAGGAVAAAAVLVLVFPAVTGLSVRQYRDQAEAERVRAQQTARLAELDRRAAVTAERHRMARELHDVVANHLSAVAIHATAAQAAHGRDEAAVRQALAVIRDSSVRGLAEMRQLIGLLRDSDGGPEAADPRRDPADPSARHDPESGTSPARPRLAAADQLVEAVRDAGVAVRFSVVGRARPVPAEVDLAGYRILQESLTNVLKHGRGGTVRAEVAYHPAEVVITVENPLPAAGCDLAPLPGAGAGLVGMRERAELLRGTLTAGPSDGFWRVRAVLPAEEVRGDG